MYIKFEDKEKGKRFTFFTRERERNGEKVTHTDRTVFGTLAEGIKTGENNGQPIWTNDYWDTAFCGKAYENALKLHNKDKIIVTEMNVRNVYRNKRCYPQIMVTDFYVLDLQGSTEVPNAVDEDEGFINIPEGIDEELPFS